MILTSFFLFFFLSFSFFDPFLPTLDLRHISSLSLHDHLVFAAGLQFFVGKDHAVANHNLVANLHIFTCLGQKRSNESKV